MVKRRVDKFISIFVALALVISFMPHVALASESDGGEATDQSVATIQSSTITPEKDTLTDQGTTFNVHTIKKNVDDDKAFVLLFMGDGFTASEQTKFLEAVKTRAEALLKVEPYRSFANNINIYAMCVESTESGVSYESYSYDTYLGLCTWGERTVTFRNNSSDGTSIAGDSIYQKRADKLKAQVEDKILTSTDSSYKPSVNTVHILSNKDNEYYGMMLSRTYSFSSLYDNGNPVGSCFVHEVSHAIGGLADEYYADYRSSNVDYSSKTSETVRWNKLIGFNGTGLFSGTGSYIPYNFCLMKSLSNYSYCWQNVSPYNADSFCEACKVEIAKNLMKRNHVSSDKSLYVAMPEITVAHDQNYGASYNVDNYRIRQYDYVYIGTAQTYTYKVNDLAEKANGKEIEFRTVVQNIDENKGRNIKLRLKTFNKDGSVKQSVESDVKAVGHCGTYINKYVDSYGTERTEERNDYYSYISERESCQSISVKMTLSSDYTSDNTILGEVIDADTNEVLTTDKELYNARGARNLEFKYVDETTGQEIAHTGGGKIPVKQNTTWKVTHPTKVNGYTYVKNSTTNDQLTFGLMNQGSYSPSQTVTYYFKKVDQETCEHKTTRLGNYTKQPTCTETGTADKVCSDCGKTIESGVSVPATGHTWVDHGEEKATCSAKGHSAYKSCSTCGAEEGKTETEIDASAHPADKLKSYDALSATCTSEGHSAYTVCEACGVETVKKETTPKTDHKEELRGVKSATCGEAGYSGDKYCSVCDALLLQGTIIPKTNSHTFETIAKVEPTCEKSGVSEHKLCKVCGTEEGKEILPATGHKNTEVRNAKEATCSEEGYTGDTWCLDCNKKISDGQAISMTEHKNTEVRDAKAATCTEAGYTGDTWCKDCNTKIESGKVVNPAGHKVGSDGNCTVCGKHVADCQHVNTKEVVDKEATCTETGLKHTWCDDCHTRIADEVEIPLKDHTYLTVEGKDATCTEKGYTSYQLCEVCGHEEGKKEIEALGHNYGDDNLCVRCKEKNPGAVKIVLSPTNTSDEVTFDKTEYAPGESANVTIKGKKVDGSFRLPSAIKVNGVTVQTSDKLLNKASWAKTNEEYKRKMNEDAKSVEFETIEQNLTSTATIAINSVSNSLSVEVEFEELTPVYRLYNMLTSEHMFTTNKAEYDGWVDKCKTDKDYWIGEGINWFAPSSQVSGTSTVRRLYNPALGALGHSSHYYTSDQTEIDTLISQYGWQDDGAANQFTSGGDVSIWTCYNEQLGSAHHYTSSKSEWEGLAAHGWDLETVKNGTTGVFKASMSAIS